MDDTTETFLVPEEYLAERRRMMILIGIVVGLIPPAAFLSGYISGSSAPFIHPSAFLPLFLFPVVVLPVIIGLQYRYMLRQWRRMKLHIGPDGIVREAGAVREVVPWEHITRVRAFQNPRGEVRAIEVSAAGHPPLMLVGFAPMADVAEKINARVPPTAEMIARRDAVDWENSLFLAPFVLIPIVVFEALRRLVSPGLYDTVIHALLVAWVLYVVVRGPSSRTNPSFRRLEVVLGVLIVVSSLAALLTPRIRYHAGAHSQRPGHASAILTMVFSPDGRTLASGSADKTVKLWAVSTAGPAPSLELIQTLSGHEDSIRALAFSPDGSRLATASADSTVRLWDARTGALKAVFKGHKRGVWSVLFSPDGKMLASAGGDGRVNLWRADPPGLVRAFKGGHRRGGPRVRFSPDGRMLSVTFFESRGDISLLWDIPRRRTLQGVPGWARVPNLGRYIPWYRNLPGVRPTAAPDLARHVPWRVTGTADGNKLAAANSGGILIVEAGPRGVEVRSSDLLQGGRQADLQPAEAIAFSPDGHLLASCGEGRKVMIWNVEEPGRHQVLPIADRDIAPYVNSIVFSPDSSTLAIEDRERAPKLWKLAAMPAP